MQKAQNIDKILTDLTAPKLRISVQSRQMYADRGQTERKYLENHFMTTKN